MDANASNASARDADSRQNEAQLRAIFEEAPIGIALVDEKGRLVKCNPALARILGYSQEELCRMAFPDFTHPDDLQFDVQQFRRLTSGEYEQYQLEKRYIRKDGATIWARLIASLVHPASDDRQFAVGMIEDITAFKATQEALRESEEKFAKAFHGNPHPILITRIADGRIVEANRTFAEWFALSPDEIAGRTTFDFRVWKSVADRDELMRALREKGVIQGYEKTVELPSGEARVTLLAIQTLSIRNEECLLIISTDITRQKQTEEALQRSEERLRRGLAAAQTGTWEWDLASGWIAWTDEVYRLFGLKRTDFDGTFAAVLKMVVAGDRERMQLEIDQELRHPAGAYHSEMRVLWPDQSVHWIESRGEVRRDSSGKSVMLAGTVVDVTARKRAELDLRSSEESLRATIENTPNVAIQWYDQAGRVLLWNRASELVFGYKSADALGHTLAELILDAADAAQFTKALALVAQTGKSVPPTEYHFRRQDGSRCVCLTTVVRIPCAADTFYFGCMDVDLTERKQAEESLRQAQQRELRSREEFTRQLLKAQEQERQRAGRGIARQPGPKPLDHKKHGPPSGVAAGVAAGRARTIERDFPVRDGIHRRDAQPGAQSPAAATRTTRVD